MKLTPLGAQVLTMGDKERLAHGTKLVKGGADINKYVTGVCYEAAAYVRALLGAKVKPNDILDVNGGPAWEKKLAFASGKEWDGKSAIKPGAAVGFFRVVDKKFFHAAISTGGTKIRAVNGHLLGNGWDEVDLKKVLGTPDADKQFDYDRTKIKVFVSKV
jgi:hypothetical protein